MEFIFDINKAVAAAAYLTKKSGGQISTFFLMKMMYSAERKALATWHRPITGDAFSSLKKGPILTRTYNLIKHEVLSTNSDMVKWAEHFFPREGYNLRLRTEPDYEHLSQQEIEALDHAFAEINALAKKHGAIADVLHSIWPEWKNPEVFGCGSVPLTLRDVLSEVVEDDHQVEELVAEISAVNSAKAALQV